MTAYFFFPVPPTVYVAGCFLEFPSLRCYGARVSMIWWKHCSAFRRLLLYHNVNAVKSAVSLLGNGVRPHVGDHPPTYVAWSIGWSGTDNSERWWSSSFTKSTICSKHRSPFRIPLIYNEMNAGLWTRLRGCTFKIVCIPVSHGHLVCQGHTTKYSEVLRLQRATYLLVIVWYPLPTGFEIPERCCSLGKGVRHSATRLVIT